MIKFFTLITLTIFCQTALAESKLKKIKDTATITMGVRESSGALSYTLGNDKYVGYHVEICEIAIASIQKKLGLKSIKINYVPVTSQNRVPLMQNGTIDIECGSTTNNTARAKDVSFAVTTFVEEVRIAVLAKSGIENINQLNKKTIATTTGTTSVQTLRKNKKASGLEFKEVFGKDHADSFLLLESGRADAFVMDGTILAGNIARAKNPKDFKIVGDVLSVEPIAIMLPKDDTEFKTAVDDAIKAIMKSGQINKIWDKWFLKPIPPANTSVGMPANENTKKAWANPNDKPAEDYLTQN